MTNFLDWFEEADIPLRDQNGKWYDAETGLYFSDREISVQKKISGAALDSRKKAKFFGGKALKGSVKQKEWAEQIRASKIASMSATDAEVCCKFKYFSHSKFWIKNRSKTHREILAEIDKAIALVNRFNKFSKDIEILNANRHNFSNSML